MPLENDDRMPAEEITQADCFGHKLILSTSDKLTFFLCSVFLVPFRLFLAFLVGFLIWLSSRLGLMFRNPDTWDDKPAHGWRAFFQNCMWTTAGYVIFYALGFRVEIVGTQAQRSEAPVLVVAPHTSFLDVFCIALCYASPVARVENMKTPVLWAPQAVGHTIFVDRRSSDSRTEAMGKIIKRASSTLPWPQLFIFTEGTTTNGKALIRFQTGGFKPGLPVQPVTIQYSRPELTTWTRDQSHRFIHSMFLLLCCPTNTIRLEFLPVYRPNSQEQNDPVLFARNVQAEMASSLGVPATDIQRTEFILESKKSN